ncbi:hypothetical protein [Bradyrhizobium sp. Tv2a-2]|uniref:hypothetical protein n=1 Tax=Bradyrhizobium sp. Tv2a-2 TaxID=113395 RepID=UPI0003F57820|nr:hypothetical protein [Bradyrhizobium sp. Tv2a-2]
MTYSCTDFTDSILSALNIVVPEDAYDQPDKQADLALAEIDRLQAIEKIFLDHGDHIIAALSLMHGIDDENGREEDAKASRDLIETLQKLDSKEEPETGTLKEAFGFSVGQAVRMLCDCSGEDHEGAYQEVEPGAKGTIDSIERYAGDQGITITVVIDTGKRDKDGDPITIVNVFDETDGPPSQFFAVVPSLGPLQRYRDALIDVDRPTSAYAIALINILKRMAEIESRSVTKSHYRDLGPDEQDEVPTGGTYNELWDAVIDEIKAVIE